MANEITQSGAGEIVHARISGVMTVADQRALDAFAGKVLDAQADVRVLVTLDDFRGWEKSGAWADDNGVQSESGHEIARIAIVGDARWQEDALLYVGKGFRATKIEFFAGDARAAAEAWLRR
jgi:hypothetical protein